MSSSSSRSPAVSVRNWPPTDPQVLADWLQLHVPARPTILDATWGSGQVWGHLPIRRSVIKCDIEPRPELDLQTDWLELPRHFAHASIDCLVWDPIHVPDVGRTSTLYTRYVSVANPIKGPSIIPLIGPFLDVAAQLVKPRTGVVLVKIADIVHSGRRQWQDLALVAEAQQRGWTACDRAIVRNRTTRTSDDKHHARYHTPNEWAEWILLRCGTACRGPGRRLQHELTCQVCGETFYARRSDARTDTPACRTKLYERRRARQAKQRAA